MDNNLIVEIGSKIFFNSPDSINAGVLVGAVTDVKVVATVLVDDVICTVVGGKLVVTTVVMTVVGGTVVESVVSGVGTVTKIVVTVGVTSTDLVVEITTCESFTSSVVDDIVVSSITGNFVVV